VILVLPFHAGDAALALKNLLWIEELDGKIAMHCILSHDDKTPSAAVAEMTAVATRVFKSVEVFFYPAPEKRHWPAAPNWAWQNIARWMAFKHNEPWLWLESDAVPLRKGWLTDIEAEHIRGKKPFSGHIVDGLGHPNGVCVYPPDVAVYSQGAFRTEETAWDVVIGADLKLSTGGVSAHVHPSHNLFQHCWAINPQDGRPWNGTGTLATFGSLHDVVRLVDVTMGLFHRCKDGSLIDWLREYYKDASAAMVPQHTKGYESKIYPDKAVRKDDQGISLSNGQESSSPASDPVVYPKTEILIVTHAKDFPWLQWNLRALRRHAVGFTGITVAIPNRDAEALQPIANEHGGAKGGIPLRIKMYKEVPGKGMIQHMAIMAGADELLKREIEKFGIQFVMHLDSDCIVKELITPDSYIRNNKPDYVWRTYDSLAEVKDGQKVVSDCAQWKAPTEVQLGFEIKEFTMCRHPSVFPVSFYKPYRDHIEAVHKMPFIDYMLSGKNSFPQDKMDFTAMGAWAYKNMHKQFTWLDVSDGNHLAPVDLFRVFWSHQPVSQAIQDEIKSFLQ